MPSRPVRNISKEELRTKAKKIRREVVRLTEEAQTAGAILQLNYASTEWHADSMALLTGRGLEPRSLGNNWLAAIYRQMILGEWL